MRILKLKIDSNQAEFDLCRDIMNRINIKHILGHEEISPGRKSDPGPAFPVDELRNRLLNSSRKYVGRDTDSDVPKKGIITPSVLNIRSGPSVTTRTIAKLCQKNTEVSILKEQNGWYNVDVTFYGKVSKITFMI